ncbi:MAG: radical SAM-associated putative lipoprotein [Alistipes sp.]|nr:radical SAM-associated putative lipoprotein [Alistipes sp.]
MRRLISFLLCLLGFSAVSCDKSNPGNLDAYGTPHVVFSLKARVIDEQGKPIKGIEVDANEHYWANDNRFSDDEGNIDTFGSVSPGNQYRVRFIDVDGEENGGEFETLELDIRDKVVKVADNPHGWCEGEYKAELGDVTLKRKQSTTDSPEE